MNIIIDEKGRYNSITQEVGEIKVASRVVIPLTMREVKLLVLPDELQFKVAEVKEVYLPVGVDRGKWVEIEDST